MNTETIVIGILHIAFLGVIYVVGFKDGSKHMAKEVRERLTK